MTIKTLVNGLIGLAIIFAWCPPNVRAQEPSVALVVQKGATVSVRYTIFDEQNVVIESNQGGDPVSYMQGQGQMIPGIDRALAGMGVGEKKTVRLDPKDAYGEINFNARLEVPKTMIPAELLTPGTKLLAHAGRQLVPGRIREIRQDTVVVDTNHPLAGKTITVEIEVIDIILPEQKPQLPVS